MSNPFTYENHVKFMEERRAIEKARREGKVVQLSVDDSGHEALTRMIRLQKKYNGDMRKVEEVMGDQYTVADAEFVSRAGDPNRFNEKTGSWAIWP